MGEELIEGRRNGSNSDGAGEEPVEGAWKGLVESSRPGL